MKTVIAALAITLASVPAWASDAWMAQYVETVKLEKKVNDAIWPNGSKMSFWASVKDDGSNRDGYAEYLCMLRTDAGIPDTVGFTISVMDVAAMARGDIKKLGTAYCR